MTHERAIDENILQAQIKNLTILIQKMSQDENILQAQINNWTLIQKKLLNDINELKKELRTFEVILHSTNINEASELGNLEDCQITVSESS